MINCEQKMDISNEAFYLLDGNIKKLDEVIDTLKTELTFNKHNNKDYSDFISDKQFEELADFENFLNSKLFNF
jgi:hypothetical protein